MPETFEVGPSVSIEHMIEEAEHHHTRTLKPSDLPALDAVRTIIRIG